MRERIGIPEKKDPSPPQKCFRKRSGKPWEGVAREKSARIKSEKRSGKASGMFEYSPVFVDRTSFFDVRLARTPFKSRKKAIINGPKTEEKGDLSH